VMNDMMGMSPSAPADAGMPGGSAPLTTSGAPAPSQVPTVGGMGAAGMGGGSPPTSTQGPSAQAGGGCGGMMGCMGGRAKPFYPTLIDMPALTPEARRFIEAEAAKRLGVGAEAITTGQMPLHDALSANDVAAMQRAIAGVREGVLQAESGAAALQAVNEGQPPRQVALTWFKGHMNVPAGGGMVMEDGPWGLSWYHLTTMAFLVAFLTGALLIHFVRTRRIGELVERLTPGGAAAAKLSVLAATSAVSTVIAAKPAPATLGGTEAAPAATASPKADSSKKPWSGALRVAAIFRETPNVKTFRLIKLEGGDVPFTFLPGQFLTFSAQIDGKPIRRSYTIASSPAQRNYVEITVKREERGAESRYLHDNVAVGDHLEVSGPSGVFTYTGKETDSIVLISGGVGITPMMCVLRYLTDCGYPGDIFFIHGARTAQDLIFGAELDYLRKRHGNAHVTVTVSDFEGSSWTGVKGQISGIM
jgi:ferredoxin-NADP reductase